MSEIKMKAAVPIVGVRDVPTSAAFYRDRLGFEIDFLYGEPPFYGAVSRGDACLHLGGGEPSTSRIVATIEVSDIRALYEEFQHRGAPVTQPPTHQPWGGTDILVTDPDGNVISFVTYGDVTS